MTTKHSELEAICAACGYRYGAHAANDYRLPMACPSTRDGRFWGWLDQTFKPVEAPALGATTPMSAEEFYKATPTTFVVVDELFLGKLFEFAEDYAAYRVKSSAPVAREGQAPDVEQLAVDLCRELYDRFMMGGWSPEDAYAETVLRLQQWAESVASPRAPETPKETVDVQSAPSKESNT